MTVQELIEALKANPLVISPCTKECLYRLGFMARNKKGNSYVTKKGKFFLNLIGLA
jgi:hypothetical protein